MYKQPEAFTFAAISRKWEMDDLIGSYVDASPEKSLLNKTNIE
jgi:hypothetical protein